VGGGGKTTIQKKFPQKGPGVATRRKVIAKVSRESVKRWKGESKKRGAKKIDF